MQYTRTIEILDENGEVKYTRTFSESSEARLRFRVDAYIRDHAKRSNLPVRVHPVVRPESAFDQTIGDEIYRPQP